MEKIGISGTRSEKSIKPYQIECLHHILNMAKNNNWLVNVGDCPTGIDQRTIQYCQLRDINYNLFVVEGDRTGQKLKSRTIGIVEHSNRMFCFPSGLKHISSGTWLACFEACRQGKKSNVCWKLENGETPPTVKEIWDWEQKGDYYLKPILAKKQQLSLF